MLKNRSIPFGYCVINGKYALNITESEAVKKIFSGYIGGKSMKTIAAEMRIPYNTNKAAWNKNMVSRVLENTPFNNIPQFRKRNEDFFIGFPLIMDKKALDVFKKKSRRLLVSDDSGKFKE